MTIYNSIENDDHFKVRVEDDLRHIKTRETVISLSPSVMALLLAACGGGGGGGVSISGQPRSITFEGEAIIGTYNDDAGLAGTEQRDIIIDNRGTNTIFARAGNDYIIATGNIDAGEGNDIVFGDGASDTIYGQEGNDILAASSGNIYGGEGHDYIQISFNDNAAEDYGQRSFVQREPINQDLDVDDLITQNPFYKASHGTTYASGGAGNDVIFVASIPDRFEMNRLIGGEGNDLLMATQDSRMIGGIGDDEFFVFFGNDENNVFDADLQVEIADFGNGTDKIVLVVDHNAHPEYDEDYDDLISFFLNGTLIDYDSDGSNDDLQVVVITTDIISKEAQTKTIIFENLGRQLTAEDFEVMSLVQFDGMVDDIQQSYIDAF